MGMKFSFGKPKLIIKADDFCDYISQESLAFLRIIGMLITGVLLGPYVLNLFDESILGISVDLRQIALVIILIKAELSLNIHT